MPAWTSSDEPVSCETITTYRPASAHRHSISLRLGAGKSGVRWVSGKRARCRFLFLSPAKQHPKAGIGRDDRPNLYTKIMRNVLYGRRSLKTRYPSARPDIRCETVHAKRVRWQGEKVASAI